MHSECSKVSYYQSKNQHFFINTFTLKEDRGGGGGGGGGKENAKAKEM